MSESRSLLIHATGSKKFLMARLAFLDLSLVFVQPLLNDHLDTGLPSQDAGILAYSGQGVGFGVLFTRNPPDRHRDALIPQRPDQGVPLDD